MSTWNEALRLDPCAAVVLVASRRCSRSSPRCCRAMSLKTQIGEQIARWTGRDVSLARRAPDQPLPAAQRHAGRRAQSAGRPAWTMPQILSMDRLKGTIRLLPLIIGRVEINSFTMVRPLVRLVRDKAGTRNWEFNSGAAALQLAFAGDVPLGKFHARGGHRPLRGPASGDSGAARFGQSHGRLDERAQADRGRRVGHLARRAGDVFRQRRIALRLPQRRRDAGARRASTRRRSA